MRDLRLASAALFTLVVPGICLAGEAAAPQATATELSWQFEYDDADRVTKVVDPASRATTLDYKLDETNRLRSLTRNHSDGTRVTLGFDRFRRRVKMDDAAGSVAYEHDGFGRLTAVRRDGQPPVAYAYDTMDRLKSVSLGEGLTLGYSYDFLGRLAAIDTPAGRIDYDYQPRRGRISRTLPNGLRTRWEYRPDGLLEAIHHVDADNKILDQFTYAYRPDGLIGTCKRWSPGSEQVLAYRYDTVQRLTSAADSGFGAFEYRYDKLGNRTELLAGERAPVASTHDWAGRMLTHDGRPCTHDPVGNLASYTGPEGQRSYRFDVLGRLEAAASKEVTVRYQHDGDGYLIARQIGDRKTTFVPDPRSDVWRPLLAVDPEGKQTLYVWDGNSPLAAISGEHARFFLHDHLGSVRAVADREGAIVERLDYTPFGLPQQESNALGLEPRFAGLFLDSESSLYLTRARAYSPRLGHFLQREPQQRAALASPKDLSAYGYCGADPVNYVDMTGCYWGPPPYIPYKPPEIDLNRYIAQSLQGNVPKQEAKNQAPRDPWYHVPLNWVGRTFQWNWCGRNVTGGNPNAYQRDSIGAYPVGDPTVAGIHLLDQAARKHDIQTFIDEHYAPGTEVEVPTPGGGKEYYTSQKLPLLTHLRVVRDVLVTLHPGLFPRYHGGSSTPSRPDAEPVPLQREGWGVWDERKAGGYPPGGGGGSGPGGPGGAAGRPGDSPLYPSNVGGVYLRGASRAIEHLGPLKGVAIDETTGRLVLLSEARGKIDLPPLRMDDVVTVFRSVYQHGKAPSVSIDPHPDDPNGPLMLVRHGPGTADTYVGWVLFEADRVMKAYSLGYDNVTREKLTSNVEGYQNLFELGFSNVGGPAKLSVWERFWIVPAEVNRLQTGNGRLTLFDVALKLNTQRMIMREGKLVPANAGLASKQARIFSQWFTGHYDDLCSEALSVPPEASGLRSPVSFFAELRRITLITAIAESLRQQGVPMPAWMRDYRVRPCPIPPTTPAILVEKTKTETGRVVRGNSVYLMETTRRQGIYGGVNLGVADQQLHTQTGAPEAEKLLPEVSKTIAAAPVLTPLTVEGDAGQLSAVVLPGNQTADLGACRLEAVDLVVPVQRGREISLARKFNSFFQPEETFGPAWTLDFPRLERRRVPVRRTGDRAEYRIRHELTSPLNTWSEVFSEVAVVAEVGQELQVPEASPEMLGVTGAEDERIGHPTTVLLFRDGRCWHFDEAGNMVAWSDEPLLAVYRRGPDQRIERIEGWYGKNLRADVRLQYDERNRMVAARGSNGEQVEYAYDEAGMLTRVKRPEEVLHYKYDHGLVAGVARNGRVVARYEYAENGRLKCEHRADGSQVAYQVSSGPEGTQIAASTKDAHGERQPLARARYDAALRPVERVLEDGTQIGYRYHDDGTTETAVRVPDGDRYVASRSPDGRQASWRLPAGGTVSAQYDEARRLTELRRGETPVVEQTWHPDGPLESVRGETVALHPEYREDGVMTGVLVVPPEEGPRFSRWLHVEYDESGRPEKLTDSSGSELSIAYDQTGQPAALRSERAGVVVQREASGKVRSVETSWGYRQTNAYDEQDEQLQEVTVTQGEDKATVEFDQGRPTKVRQFDGGEAEISYYEDDAQQGLPKQVRTANDVVLGYQYDVARQLASVNCNDAYKLKLTYDDRGRMTGLAQAMIRK